MTNSLMSSNDYSPAQETHDILFELPYDIPGFVRMPERSGWRAGDVQSYEFTFPDKTAVDVELSATDSGNIYLGLLMVRRFLSRGKGYGKAVLNMLCDWADSYELSIELLASPIKQEMTEDKLIEWYEKFGFEQNTTLRRLDKAELIRYPRSAVLSEI